MNIFNLFTKKFGKNEKSFNNDTWTSFGGVNAGGVSNQNTLHNFQNWVFVAVDKNASSVANARYKVMKYDKGDDVEVFEGDIYNFMQKPCDYLSFKELTYISEAYKELAGNSFWKLDEDKKVIPLIPTKVSPLIKDGMFTGYKYQNGTKTEALEIDEVKHDKIVDLEKPYWGRGILTRIAGWVDTDRYASEFNRLFFINGASFGGFIETDEESRERIELIKTGLVNQHTGVGNAHKIAILPKNSKFASAGSSMRDMEFSTLDDKYRDKILSGFGVPKTLVGLTTEVNRASAEASEYIYAQYTIKPKVEKYVEFLNNEIIPLFDKSGKYYIAYEEFVPDNMDYKLREREIALNRQPYKTINEVRSENGLPPITGGDVVYGAPFNEPIGEPIPQKSNKPEPRTTLEDKIDKIAKKTLEITKPTEEEIVDIKHKEFVARTESFIDTFTEKIQLFNDKQKAKVYEKLNMFVEKAVAKKEIFDFDNEVGTMVDFVKPMLKVILTEQALREFEDQGFQGAVDITTDKVDLLLQREAKRVAKSYNDTTLKLLKRTINDGIVKGEGIRELTDRVSKVYEFSNVSRAKMVAHTESFYIANEGSKIAYQQSGVVSEMKWYTAYDERTCEFCGPMHEKVIGISETFFNKGETVTGSQGGKMSADYRAIDVPPLHPNCRCFIRPETIEIKDIKVETKKEDLSDLLNLLDNE